MAKWIEYTGSDEQIEEIGISLSYSGYITRNAEGIESKVVCTDTTRYIICEPHPYADIIKIWADTGCEVYICEHHNNYYDGILESTDCFYHPPTNKPNWNIPGAEYRLTPFED